ncbi:MAG: DUF932 domain-containing protein [Candidatus Woesearchaeota archaeon]|jgi:hypothetical protein
MNIKTLKAQPKSVTDNYKFPVSVVPLTAGKIVIDNKFAIVREDTSESIGLVSDSYGLLKHSTVIDNVRELLGKQAYKEKVEVQRNGALLFATYTFPNQQIEVKKGDYVAMQMIVKNSYDGSQAFQIMLGALRLVCTNGMVMGKQFFGFMQKHYSNSGNIDSAQLKERFGGLSLDFKKTLPLMQIMTKKNLPENTDAFRNTIKDKVFPQYVAEKAEENFKKEDKTVWGYYNALTATITHTPKKDLPDTRIEFTRRAWESAILLTK